MKPRCRSHESLLCVKEGEGGEPSPVALLCLVLGAALRAGNRVPLRTPGLPQRFRLLLGEGFVERVLREPLPGSEVRRGFRDEEPQDAPQSSLVETDQNLFLV